MQVTEKHTVAKRFSSTYRLQQIRIIIIIIILFALGSWPLQAGRTAVIGDVHERETCGDEARLWAELAFSWNCFL